MSENPAIPDDWERVRLSDLAIKIGSGATPRGGRDVYVPSGVNLIRSQNVLDHRMSTNGLVCIDGTAANALRSVEVLRNDVLLNITGDSIARCAIVEPDFLPARVNQHVAIIRANERINPVYLQKFLVQPTFKASMLSLSDGATRAALTKKQIEDFHIILPPRQIQDAIAEVAAALDDKSKTNERIVQYALSLADAHFTSSYAAGGPEATFGDLSAAGLFSFGDGYRTKKSEHGQPGLPILRVAEVGEFDIFPTYEDYVSIEYRRSMNQKISRARDVILTTKGTVGRSTIVPADLPEFVYSPQICYFRPSTGQSTISSEFLYLWFRCRPFWEQASSRKGQTDMADYLSLADIRTLRIRTLDKQDAGELQIKVAPLLSKAETCRRENRTLAELRDTLLPKLISGELRMKDADRIVSNAI